MLQNSIKHKYEHNMNIGNNNQQEISFFQDLLSKVEPPPEVTKVVPNDQPQASENKPIDNFMVTDATLAQEMKLGPKEFIQKLNAGELTNETSKIIVTGNVCITRDIIRDITKLPANLEIQGKLACQFCSNLNIFPENLKARGLSISSCNKLVDISGNIEVEKEIRIVNCDNLKSFSPSNIISNLTECLDITNCPKLEKIPHIKTIGTSLNIINCPELTSLSTINIIKGYIQIKDCPKITEIPEHWMCLPLISPKPNVKERFKVELLNTGITLENLALYNQKSVDGIDFAIVVEEKYKTTFKNLDEAVFYFRQFTNKYKEVTHLKIDEQLEKQFCSLFYILAVYKKLHGINQMQKSAEEILNFLNLLSKADQSLKDSVYEQIHENFGQGYQISIRRGVVFANNCFRTMNDILE